MASEQDLSPLHFMRLALAEARRSPPKPTNFCVGAVLVSQDFTPAAKVLVTGYTLECPGNTHAEQSCFIKLAEQHNCSVEHLGEHLISSSSSSSTQHEPDNANDILALYTTMEPCNQRSPGNTPCVDRILALKSADGRLAIRRVYVGVSEPETFVGVNLGRRKLVDAGIEVVHVPGLEEEILEVATAGHGKEG
jgi:pyrimidine deaminase RibD-like protein